MNTFHARIPVQNEAKIGFQTGINQVQFIIHLNTRVLRKLDSRSTQFI